MTKEQALEQLKFHSGRHPDVNSAKWSSGFLPSLRPFNGLNRPAFDNLMECLDILKDEIQGAEALDRELITDLWIICHYAKALGTDPEGMIRRNNIIFDQELKELEHWINRISFRVSWWLEGLEEED
ncbi:MAG: hypothetical protein HOP30_14890 [Cyclobacteriaceae bacterium]|nr:hypothetical protein [Cyclobacteriaceae bacterium]